MRITQTLLIALGFILSIGHAAAQSAVISPKFEKSISNLRNQRYCEVLYGKRDFLKLEVKVFNTQGLNLCPEDQWKAITKESVEKAYDASFVVLNGPRYWMMDEIQAAGDTVNPIKESFSGMEMHLRATVKLNLLKQLMGSKQFSPNEISRTTNFVYKAGTPIYELTSPAGDVYKYHIKMGTKINLVYMRCCGQFI